MKPYLPPSSGALGRTFRIFGWGGLGLVLAAPFGLINSEAAINMFLKLDDIKGESNDKRHKDEIDILAGSWGASNSGTTHLGGGGGAGKASVQDFSLTKYTDLATPELILKLLTGQHIPEGELTFAQAGGDQNPIVTLKFKDIIVSAHNPGGSGGEDRLTENFTLNFAEFTYQTYSYNEAGVETGTPAVTWNIPGNTGELTEGPPSNNSPSISNIGNQVLAEDQSQTFPFTISDTETPAGSLTLSRSTTNPMVVPLSGISFGGSGSNRTVTITPAANASGSATIGITVTDASGAQRTDSFAISVTAVNDAPAIQSLSDQVGNLDSTTEVSLNVSDIDTPEANLSIIAHSSDHSLIPPANITFTGSGAATVMRLTPLAGVSGSATLTLTVNDGDLSSLPTSFLYTVNSSTNDGPTDIQLTGPGGIPLQVNENSLTNILVGSLTATDPDDGNNLAFTLIDSAGGRFQIGGTNQRKLLVDDGSLLDFESASSHTIIVKVTDPAGHSFQKSFSIVVNNVNEAPVITTSLLFPFSTDNLAPLSGIAISDPDAGSANISVTFAVSEGSLSLSESGSLAGKVSNNNSAELTVIAPVSDISSTLASDGLSYSTMGSLIGTHQLTITADDLGHDGIGGAQSATVALDLEITGTRFTQWRQDWFPAQLADLAISGPLADPDGDGVANLIEYGIGTSPTDSKDGLGFVQSQEYEEDGVLYLAIKFNRLISDLDPLLLIDCQLATNDLNWGTNPDDTILVSTSIPEEGATHEEVIIRSSIPISDGNMQMLRLRFSLQVPQ